MAKILTEGILKIVLPIVLGAVIALVLGNTKSIAGLEADHVTAQQHLDVWLEIEAVKADVARNEPPDWLVKRLDAIEMAVRENHQLINEKLK